MSESIHEASQRMYAFASCTLFLAQPQVEMSQEHPYTITMEHCLESAASGVVRVALIYIRAP